MNRLFDLVKKEYLSDGASQDFVESASSLVETTLNYWITLDQDKPKNDENVLVLGFMESSPNITCTIAKYNSDRKIFIEGDSLIRVMGWRPLPQTQLRMPND